MDINARESHGWARLLNTGFLYVSKRDKKGRPVIIMNVERILQNECSEEELIQMCNYFFTFVI